VRDYTAGDVYAEMSFHCPGFVRVGLFLGLKLCKHHTFLALPGGAIQNETVTANSVFPVSSFVAALADALNKQSIFLQLNPVRNRLPLRPGE
jgi:hypothetical protein